MGTVSLRVVSDPSVVALAFSVLTMSAERALRREKADRAPSSHPPCIRSPRRLCTQPAKKEDLEPHVRRHRVLAASRLQRSSRRTINTSQGRRVAQDSESLHITKLRSCVRRLTRDELKGHCLFGGFFLESKNQFF